MCAGTTRLLIANHGLFTTQHAVDTQGSHNTEKAPFADLRSLAEGFSWAEKMRRKVESALRCLTVTDIED